MISNFKKGIDLTLLKSGDKVFHVNNGYVEVEQVRENCFFIKNFYSPVYSFGGRENNQVVTLPEVYHNISEYIEYLKWLDENQGQIEAQKHMEIR